MLRVICQLWCFFLPISGVALKSVSKKHHSGDRDQEEHVMSVEIGATSMATSAGRAKSDVDFASSFAEKEEGFAEKEQDFARRSGLMLIKRSGRLNSSDTAVVTHICDDQWAIGAVALGASVRKFQPRADVVVMITQKVSTAYHDLLAKTFDSVYLEEPILPHPSITRAGADCLTLQIRAWALPYKKALYMDSDMLLLTNPDPILAKYGELSAKTDPRPIFGFNGGMFVMEPKLDSFNKLRSGVKNYPFRRHKEAPYHGIQQYLNHMYPRCRLHGIELKGPPPGLAGCWRQDFETSLNFQARELTPQTISALLASNFTTVKSLHFSGDWGRDLKPWQSGCMMNSDSLGHSGDPELHRKLITVWVREFKRFKAPPGSEELLKLKCDAAEKVAASMV